MGCLRFHERLWRLKSQLGSTEFHIYLQQILAHALVLNTTEPVYLVEARNFLLDKIYFLRRRLLLKIDWRVAVKRALSPDFSH